MYNFPMETREFIVGSETTRVFYGELKDFDRLSHYGDALWVVDENTRQFLPSFAEHVVELPSGEVNKTWQSIEKILDAALDLTFGRDSTIVALGGGVICDMVGFAASIYMRGCGLVLIPSTLLAMNDASLGGKTGIDYRKYKNMLGAFYPAEEIYIFSDILMSLSPRDYRSGLAEVIKHAFLGDRELLASLRTERESLLRRDRDILKRIIPVSLNIKGSIVQQDAKEHGLRAHLNLGHTFGHALETVTGFSVTHGEAVAWGINKAKEAGMALGETDAAYAGEVKALLLDYGYTLSYENYHRDELIETMSMDKKKRGGVLRFVLQRNIGDTFLREIPREILMDIL